MALMALLPCMSSGAQDDLYSTFLQPPDSTRTKVWWFHGETAATHESITADLEAFRHQGVGSVVFYDQVHGKGDGASDVFSPAWWDELTFSAREARRLGLSFEVNIGNGYVAGGKWITPDKSMQTLACTEMVVDGGRDLSVVLPLPEKMPGGWHHDEAVVAVRYDESLLAQVPMEQLSFDSDRPFTARSITYEVSARGKARTSSMQVPPSHFTLHPEQPAVDTSEFFGCGFTKLPPVGELQASDDGVVYRKVCDLRPRYRNFGGVKRQTVAFAPVSARHFRIVVSDATTKISVATLSARAAVDAWQQKASLISEFMDNAPSPPYSPGDLVDFTQAIDLTSHLAADGTLTWPHSPRGKWLVLRFLSISNGGHTKHGRAEALGLECDKLSVEGARQQWRSYVKPVIDSIRAHGGALDGICMDSHEAGPQNWTVGFAGEFARLRGYDMMRMLPVMAGFVVDSPEASEAFLSDLRHTINELVADRYFGEFNRLCRSERLPLTAQAIGGALCMAGDAISVKRFIDKPQGEFWAYQTEGNYDIKDCASAAHLYGKHVASGEAFTDATFKHSLADIKHLYDYALAFGINEFVVCAVAYQPWVRQGSEPPYINTANGRQYVLHRLNTLWPMSRPFWDYQARGAWLMRQGKPVADVCIYLGDEIPMRTLAHRLPPLPQGYDFDACTTDALLHRLKAEGGRLTLPDGVGYGMLVLPPDGQLPAAARQQVEAFRRQGVPVYDPQTDSRTLATALREAGLPADIETGAPHHIYFAHRRTTTADIYFVDNHGDEAIDDTVAFNTSATVAERWDAVTGERWPLDIARAGERTATRLHIGPREAYFYVFHHGEGLATTSANRAATPPKGQAITLSTPWDVTFNPLMGGPTGVQRMDTLADWTKHADPRIRHYSGTAIYRNTFRMKKSDLKQSCRLCLSLLNAAAEVYVNGHAAGIVWCAPYELDITPYIRKGKNDIEIHVANCLWNRFVGDAQQSEGERILCPTHPLAQPDDALVPSGMTHCGLLLTL